MSCKLIVCKMQIKLKLLFTTVMSNGILADLCHLEGLTLSVGIVFHYNICRQMIAYFKK